MLIRLSDGKTTFLDYRETAPSKASRDMYLDKDGKLDEEASVIGYRSVAVAGTVAGLELALKTYGTMKVGEGMAPAIRIADRGLVVSRKLATELEEERPGLQTFPQSRRIFLNEGKMFKVGDILKQPVLAATLKRIAQNGSEEFYRGETAKLLADEMSKNGGLLTLEDLPNYKVRVREPPPSKFEIDRPPPSIFPPPPPPPPALSPL